MKIPENTKSFQYNNPNPKGRKTCDCVVRAICTALGQSYEQTARELTEYWLETGYHPGSVQGFGGYLESKGWVKNKQPRKSDNTKYTGYQFVKLFKGVCVANIGGNHTVCIKDGKVLDTWDSTDGCIGNYWTRKNA